MELAWNTQKNKMSDVKGKEMEQDRKGKISNEDIDLKKTHLNYDLVQSDLNLYQRVKSRVDELKKSGSRVQKNSVVDYSNILTVSKEQSEIWGTERTRDYFETCYKFFCNEFGKENVVSAKIHLDESSPHMHLHFVPVNKENGRLQARIAMNKEKINYIHGELPIFLQNNGFDVVRGRGNKIDNIENVHEFKKIKSKIAELEREQKFNNAFLEKQKTIISDNQSNLENLKSDIEKQEEKLGNLNEKMRVVRESTITLSKLENLEETGKRTVFGKDLVISNDQLEEIKEGYKELAGKYHREYSKNSCLMSEVSRLTRDIENQRRDRANLREQVEKLENINSDLQIENIAFFDALGKELTQEEINVRYICYCVETNQFDVKDKWNLQSWISDLEEYSPKISDRELLKRIDNVLNVIKGCLRAILDKVRDLGRSI